MNVHKLNVYKFLTSVAPQPLARGPHACGLTTPARVQVFLVHTVRGRIPSTVAFCKPHSLWSLIGKWHYERIKFQWLHNY